MNVNLKEPEIIEIKNFTGSLTFYPAYPAKIPVVELTSLKSWTDYDNPAIRYFSGKAVYDIHFKLPESVVPGKDSVMLSLGNVESIAGIRLNKTWMGNCWIPDFAMDVTGILQKDNELLVEVANVYRNRIIGDLVEDGHLHNVWTTSPVETLFENDKTLKPSGLLGPIRLFKYPAGRIGDLK
jgi:hypothetical protein